MLNLTSAILIGMTVFLTSTCEKRKEPEATPSSPVSTTSAALKPQSEAVQKEEAWAGVYSTPAEVGGFSGTALVIEKKTEGGYTFRRYFYSDVGSNRDRETSGDLVVQGDQVRVDESGGSAQFALTQYSRRRIQNRDVLLRQDAMETFEKQGKLYDYGILIKVGDLLKPGEPLDSVKHESIRVLYRDPAGPWKDPFVHGPNAR